MKNTKSSHRHLGYGIAGDATVTALGGPVVNHANADATSQRRAVDGSKIAIVYFSHSGNTRAIAEQIHAYVGGTMVEIKTVVSYSMDYDTAVDQAKKELRAKSRPQLATDLSAIASYDTLFVGYPNWWGTMPMAMFTFFETANFQGKTLVPFATHEGSHFGSSLSDLKALNPSSTILEGLTVRGRSVRLDTTRKDVSTWLTGLGFESRVDG